MRAPQFVSYLPEFKDDVLEREYQHFFYRSYGRKALILTSVVFIVISMLFSLLDYQVFFHHESNYFSIIVFTRGLSILIYGTGFVLIVRLQESLSIVYMVFVGMIGAGTLCYGIIAYHYSLVQGHTNYIIVFILIGIVLFLTSPIPFKYLVGVTFFLNLYSVMINCILPDTVSLSSVRLLVTLLSGFSISGAYCWIIQKRSRQWWFDTRELDLSRKREMRNAHQCGQTEIATTVMHNVGNVLNSISVLTQQISTTLNKSQVKRLCKTLELIDEHKDSLDEFLLHDDRGKKVLPFLLALSPEIQKECSTIAQDVDKMSRHVESIRAIVEAQNNFVYNNVSMKEYTSLTKILDSYLLLEEDLFKEHHIVLEKKYRLFTQSEFEVAKITQVLATLLKNAVESLCKSSKKSKKIIITVQQQENMAHLSICDNGMGIPHDDQVKIFNLGYSTKADAFGYGLHASANLIAEMGGKISVYSDGEGQGAQFLVELPIVQKSTS